MQTFANDVFQKIRKKYGWAVDFAKDLPLIPYGSRGRTWTPPPFDGNSWWTCGFWPALLWQLHAATGEEKFKAEARRAQALLFTELLRHDFLNHDVGFMYLLSEGADYRLTGNEESLRRTLMAADVLAGRYNPAGFIRAWNGRGREGYAIVDCLMNLPLLYFASEKTGDPRYLNIAKSHADTTIRCFVREDGSCNHIVIFDPMTGKVVDAPGGQGYEKGSSWSRGQAWALYGFTLSFMNTGEQRYLDTAKKIARYFISNIREDGLTDCDFRQPKAEERIDNIAGACAACGLLELAKLDPAGKETYEKAALRLLTALDSLCADWTQESYGILQKCTASYHDDGAGRHVNITYGDYFFVEAICKLRGTDIMLWGK
jgi:unsaturated chondroitin disaccharide hydrolase